MNRNNFYIELSSNVTGFEKNTIGNFITKLACRQYLKGEWEIALVEISYTKSWFNIKEDIEITIIDDNKKEYSPLKKYPIKKGNYDLSSLVEGINKAMSAYILSADIRAPPVINYELATNRVFVTPGRLRDSSEDKVKINLKGLLPDILGYNYEETTIDQDGSFVSKKCADVDAGFHTLFVYCDIVEPQLVGNSQVKLLKTVEVPSDKYFGNQIVINYSSPHYVPLLYNEFETIEIDIKDDVGDNIYFNFGRVRVKLHFREKQ